MHESQQARLSNTQASDAAGLDDRARDRVYGQKVYRRAVNLVRRLIADETAATAIEYCLIATGIALGILVAIAGIEAKINADFAALNGSLK
jgi:pilus assembly protein Flp/PilA